jgi:glycine dehydrogenase subunit 1
MPYTSHTNADIKDMLDVIGIKNEEELFDLVPKELRTKSFNVLEGLDEFSTFESFKELSLKNKSDQICFMGGGYYDHIIPTAIDALASRSEFYTAYTPYQAEASQGTLQSLYEYQSLMCELSGMEVSNASLYDGATALAEASLMAVRITKRNKILLDGGINKDHIKIIQTYLDIRDIECEVIDIVGDITDFKMLNSKIDDSVAGYIFQNPNFFGTMQDFSNIIDTLHQNKCLAIMSFYPISLGLMQDPGSLGVDIACADGQSLGNYLNLGGPYFGILATKKEFTRDIPGRIIGITLDKNEKEIFVLTLQAREQHIRRHRATSNICTNQNLLALRGTIFLSLLGVDGLSDLSNINYQKSEYLKQELSKIPNISIWNTAETFNEFVISLPINSTTFIKAMNKNGYLAGVDLSKMYDGFKDKVLLAVTETRSKKQIDDFVNNIKKVIS